MVRPLFPLIIHALMLAVAFLTPSPAATDASQANAYDAAWQAQWVAHCQSVYASTGKTAGFVLDVGDSITHANPYSQWPRLGVVRAADDQAIMLWCQANAPFSSSPNDATSHDGFYLAGADTSQRRGMTASGGLETGQLLSGDGNGGAAMPAATDHATAVALITDGVTYPNNINLTTLISAFSNAQFVVLMLGTNDVSFGISVSQFTSNLNAIIDAFEGNHIVTLLSTIPPNPNPAIDALAVQFCAAIASTAQQRGLPLIDFRAEILARRPGTSWNGTLITLNDVHPTASGGIYTASSDPYADGGDPSSHLTGAACLNVGYLLRDWLTIQKLKQVKALVVDASVMGTGPGGTAATGSPGTSSAGATTASGTSGTTSTASSSSGSRCGISSSVAALIGLALILLRRRTR